MTGIDVTAERATAGLVNHLMEASFTTALVGIDTGGRISVVNSGTEHLLGYDRHELVGHAVRRPAQVQRAVRADRCGQRRGGVRNAGAWARPRRRDQGPGLDLGQQGRRRPAGLDDAERLPGRLRRPQRLPVRRPRRQRAAAQPGDADRRPRQGAHRRRAAPRAGPGQERVRVHGLARAAHAGDEHRRLRRDAARR